MSEKELPKLPLIYEVRLALSFAVIVVCIFLTACYPTTTSKGVVKDGNGQPVADAVVKIGGKSAKAREIKTNPDGTFDFSNIEIISHQNPMEIQLTVEKSGFDKFSKQLTFDAQNTDEIILQKPNS